MDQRADIAEEAVLARRIVAAASGRDRDAEERFCSRFAPRIRLFGLRRLRSDAAAADLVQDVLILVLDKLRTGAVREPDQVAAFVFGTARQLGEQLGLTAGNVRVIRHRGIERLRRCVQGGPDETR